MNFENSDGNNGNSYSYTYVTNHISVRDSFNVSNSHNGHGRVRGGGCLIGLLVAVLPALLAIYMLFDAIAGWLT